MSTILEQQETINRLRRRVAELELDNTQVTQERNHLTSEVARLKSRGEAYESSWTVLRDRLTNIRYIVGIGDGPTGEEVVKAVRGVVDERERLQRRVELGISHATAAVQRTNRNLISTNQGLQDELNQARRELTTAEGFIEEKNAAILKLQSAGLEVEDLRVKAQAEVNELLDTYQTFRQKLGEVMEVPRGAGFSRPVLVTHARRLRESLHRSDEKLGETLAAMEDQRRTSESREHTAHQRLHALVQILLDDEALPKKYEPTWDDILNRVKYRLRDHRETTESYRRINTRVRDALGIPSPGPDIVKEAKKIKNLADRAREDDPGAVIVLQQVREALDISRGIDVVLAARNLKARHEEAVTAKEQVSDNYNGHLFRDLENRQEMVEALKLNRHTPVPQWGQLIQSVRNLKASQGPRATVGIGSNDSDENLQRLNDEIGRLEGQIETLQLRERDLKETLEVATKDRDHYINELIAVKPEREEL